MAETQDETKQAGVDSPSAAAKKQQELEEVLAGLMKEAEPAVNEHVRRLDGLWFPLFIVGLAIGSARAIWGEWQPTFEFAAAALTAVGTAVIVLGGLPSPRTAAMMSVTRYNGNPSLLAELLKNRMAARSGLRLVVFGFLCQLALFASQRLNIE